MFQVAFNYPKISLQKHTFSRNNISFKGDVLPCDVFEKSEKSSFSVDDIPVDDNSQLNSKTMRLLYSPEFAPKRRRDESGDYVTTLIDKRTQKPVEALVKQVAYVDWGKDKPPVESWEIYVDSNGEKKLVGSRNFRLDYKNKIIAPGWMDSYNNNERYAGIGLRCHQIAVERMMQEGFKTVEINYLPQAFPFHYKSGFRIDQVKTIMDSDTFKDFLTRWHTGTGLSKDDLNRNVVYEFKDGNFIVDSQTIENFRKESYLRGKNPRISDSLTMSLHGEWLETWKKMAKSQPILLDN